MKIHTAEKDQLDKTYNTLVDVAINNHPLEEIRPHIDEQFMGYGTALDEVLYGWKGIEWMVKRQREEIKESEYAIQRHPVFRNVDLKKGTAFIVEEIEFTIYLEEGNHGFTLRLSTLMDFNNDLWMIRHFHGSTADMNTADGNSWPIEEWKRRNAELQREVNLRTEELQLKNRELELEAALERVRAVAMGMSKPADLSHISEILFTQIKSLGFSDLRNTEVIINDDEHESITSYYFSDYGVKGTVNVNYNSNPILKKWADDLKKSDDAFAEVIISEKEIEDWKDYRISLGYQPDPKLNKSKEVFYYSYSTGLGALSISSFTPVNPDKIKILERFRNVFQLAYQKYVDITFAEAQSREARIEAALESIRSRSLAVTKSEEFNEVVGVVFEKLNELDIPVDSVTIALTKKGTKDLNVYGCGSSEAGIAIINFQLPYFPNAFIDDTFEALNSSESGYYSKIYSEKEKNEYYDYALKNTDLINLPPDIKQRIQESKTYALSVAHTKSSMIMLNEFDGKILNEGDADILKRFSRVFEQAYIRFLDLQKAEAQTRKAQIEAALERVRSRSLAMHKSEELGEVITVVVEQLRALDFSVDDGVALITHVDGSKDLIEWMENPGFPQAIKFYLPYFDHPVLSDLWKAKNDGAEFLATRYTSEENKSFLNHIFNHSDFKHTPQEIKDNSLAAATYGYSIAFQKNTGIFINDYSGYSLTKDEIDILKRFSLVFEQAFTRFLDLQKAEAQTREAKIEASLERVRAASMAMHKTTELGQVVEVLFNQFSELDLDFYQVWINIFKLDEGISNCWFSPVEGVIEEAYTAVVPLGPFEESSIKSWRAGEEFSYLSWSGLEEVDAITKSLTEMTGHSSFVEIQKRKRMDRLEIVDCNHKYGVMAMAKNEDVTDNDRSILKRFTKVFEQTYTRFLDLQKAEAQAREAQIEAALEKIRSHTMGMRSSDDLSNVATVMFDQLKILGGNLYSFGIVLCDEQKSEVEQWHRLPGTDMLTPFYVPKDLDYIHQYRYDQWKEGEELFSIIIPEDYIDEHFELMFALPSVKSVFESMEEEDRSELKVPTWEIDYGASFKYGYLLISALKPFEENHIFPRFAKVFDQAYTRFLDLQKAEAQTREAQIETALEKIRSRSMGMNKSSELLDVIKILSNEITRLGVRFNHVSFGVNDLQQDFHFWTSIAQSEEPIKIHVPAMNSPVHKNIRKAQKEGVDFFTDHLSAKVNDDWTEHLQKHLEKPFLSKKDLAYIKGKEINRSVALLPTIFIILAKYSPIPFSDEENQILKRTAYVFEQTYTRFLDLQKAEAQAREAKIETALEKVRSRTMAMHTADELEDVVVLVVEKLMELNVVLDANGVILCTYFSDSRDVLHWISSPDYTFSGSYLLPYFEHPIFSAAWESRLSGDEYFSKSFSVEEKNSFWEYAFEHSDYKHMPEEFKEWVFQNDKHSLSFAWAENSAILIPSHTGVIPTESDVEILKRFARVFEQAYVRFMDLQKSEKAARETLIELSLEKIRALVASMQESSDLLDIVVTIRKEFVALGYEAHYFWYMRWLPDIYEKAMTSGDGTKIGNVLKLPRKIHGEIKNIATWEKGKNPTIIHVMDSEAAIDYVHKMIDWGDFEQVDQNVPSDDDIRHIGGLTYVMARTSQGEIGYSLPGMVPDPPQEAVDTLVRFASVFDLAYKRFQDLKESEQKAQILLEERNRLEKTLSELQAAQAQLIHAEKMASLGELTAGIAHEIQNPLNFVNNFSEVSSELIEEVKEEMEAGEYEEASAILEDLMQNLQKIHHHGERASSIVNGMLDHSRADSGEKVKADINQLADECMRLSYHGMRAKDRDFQSEFDIQLDPDLPKLKIVSQDIGRVLLNLINNAFQATNEKSKSLTGLGGLSGKDDYKPLVTVGTKSKGDRIEITVTDNGSGIPDDIKSKIFQPFFTTKPTGEGTGLGLSLSYDIVKAHDGELTVTTEIGKGSNFIITLPKSNIK